ncbi:MAG: hypothetical protein ACRDD9_06700 [Shewanella sp.]
MATKRIVIVGGGAAGLALASKLGRKMGGSDVVDVCLNELLLQTLTESKNNLK